MMPIPQQFEIKKMTHGLYESYYFRGTMPDGSHAFWLKHNFLRRNGGSRIEVENILIVFDKKNQCTTVYRKNQELEKNEFDSLSSSNWDQYSFFFPDGSFFEISQTRVRGAMVSPDAVQWDFALKRSQQVYYHFDRPWFYRGFFPKKKILTRDIRLEFEGQIQTSEGLQRSQWVGMNGHNWGREHAYRYAYGNCNLWKSEKDVYFDGFSAKIKLGPIISPFLSGCSLKVGEDWFHFNSVIHSWEPRVDRMERTRWKAQYQNSTHRLELDVIGPEEDPGQWVVLDYAHPSGAHSWVHNTKYAKATVRLFKKTALDVPLYQFESNLFELETL